MTADLTAPIFTNEDAARAHFEAIRWPEGRVCPHCGVVGESTLMKGKSTRPGLYKCRPCRKPFTATMGTVYERSHIPLHKWLLATHLMCSSKKGMSAMQLFRTLGFGSYRTAWFMAHRIREAMTPLDVTPMGSGGGVVEADETYFGTVDEPSDTKRDGTPFRKGGRRGITNKRAVVALVTRGGSVRSFHVKRADANTVLGIIRENVSPRANLMTDESALYNNAYVATHESVKHSAREYVRGDVHTNTIEGFFSIFKRGMRGIYQHCGEKHLHRYLSEFDFRYSEREAVGVSDKMRAAKAVRGAVGRRLTYQETGIGA